MLAADDDRSDEDREALWEFGGKLYQRIPFGSESDDWGANEGPCHDCGVRKGHIHVLGCDVERCPACDGQFIFCDCDDEPNES